MKRHYLILGSLLIWHMLCGVYWFLYAPSVNELSTLWLLNFGFLLGLLLSSRPRSGTAILAFLLSTVIPLTMWIRSLPIYSLDKYPVTSIHVNDYYDNWSCEIDNPAEVKAFEEYVHDGSWSSISKAGYGYTVMLTGDGYGRTYYVLGNCFGSMPGGWQQSVFCPKKPDFLSFFEHLVARHGGKPRH